MTINSSFLSEQDQRWTVYKAHSEQLSEYYRDSQFNNYSQRMINCAEFLKFQCLESGMQLLNARFCRVRHCAVCQWRRSLQWKARAYQTLPQVIVDFPKDRWLFLTLTIRNCPVEELRERLAWMNASFNRLTRLKAWYARGWIKSTEITRGHDGLAHPHFHCLLMVPASYFSGNKYLSQAKWVQFWQQSLKVEYAPVVDVRAIKRTDKPMTLIPEILKYQTKVTDLITDPEWLLELTRQIHGTRAIASGGVLKTYLQQPKGTGSDKEEKSEHGGQPLLHCSWNRQSQLYQQLYKFNS